MRLCPVNLLREIEFALHQSKCRVVKTIIINIFQIGEYLNRIFRFFSFVPVQFVCLHVQQMKLCLAHVIDIEVFKPPSTIQLKMEAKIPNWLKLKQAFNVK